MTLQKLCRIHPILGPLFGLLMFGSVWFLAKLCGAVLISTYKYIFLVVNKILLQPHYNKSTNCNNRKLLITRRGRQCVHVFKLPRESSFLYFFTWNLWHDIVLLVELIFPCGAEHSIKYRSELKQVYRSAPWTLFFRAEKAELYHPTTEPQDYEMLEFFIKRLKLWLGLKKTKEVGKAWGAVHFMIEIHEECMCADVRLHFLSFLVQA